MSLSQLVWTMHNIYNVRDSKFKPRLPKIIDFAQELIIPKNIDQVDRMFKEEVVKLQSGEYEKMFCNKNDQTTLHKVLMETTLPLHLNSLTSHNDQENNVDKQGLKFPSSVTRKLQVIAERLNATNSMKTLALSYLENSTGDFEVAHGMENCVDQ
ncbi:hypothetical protein MTR_8g037770 [Medicago truncatula]|uniref:Uncharacterized protein n=1 Tax=Medicago truncatula TaxID=3880 RepID=G7LEI8_MEDTR|nr:hypothetical protein MTR_8g037770 [Medicago truncatula]